VGLDNWEGNEMEDKKTSPAPKKILGAGCAVTSLFTILGAIIISAETIISLLSFPETLNHNELEVLIWTSLLMLIGAVRGAMLGVVVSGVIALIIWLRSKKNGSRWSKQRLPKRRNPA
jgi:hypothetical protein